jgi:hypothetical protein
MSSRATLCTLFLLGCGAPTAESATKPPAPPQTAATTSLPSPAPTSSTSDAPDARAADAVAVLVGKPIALPGASAPAFLDYIAYERPRSRVWVPVGSTGSVDVLDAATGTFARVDGFKTEEREVRGKKRTLGPSSAAVGAGFVYVGNRATSEVCPIDVATLKPRPCVKLASPIDGVAYVPSAKEVWVTMPKDEALAILDASNAGSPRLRATIKLDGAPEGYAADDTHGRFFTNLEDKGPTVVVEVKTHKVKAKWNPSCGADGPRGLAFDAAHDFLVVACTDHLQVLDSGHDGAPLGRLETGGGVDNIDLVDGRVYAAAGKAATLIVAELTDKGALKAIAKGTTSEGARNAVADANGNAYVADANSARVIVFPAPPRK